VKEENAAGATGRRIAQELRQDVLEGKLRPGERIGQEELAERFDASRIPVREGLKLLESEGLITIVPNAGAWVSKLDAFEFDQTYKLREQVESGMNQAVCDSWLVLWLMPAWAGAAGAVGLFR
jgi:DNA-binding GntR family transcriptional regulator